MLPERLHEIVSCVDQLEKMVDNLFDPADETLTNRSTRKNISDKLRSLEDRLLKASIRVRTHINSLATVHTLPAEILTHTFTLVPPGFNWPADRGITPYWGPAALGPPSHVVPLTEVCRHWRDILVQNPRFWAVVADTMGRSSPSSDDHALSTSGSEWDHDPEERLEYPHYLHRNPNGPLFVEISTNPTEKTIDLLRKAGSRVRELFIHYDEDCAPGTLNTVISTPAGALETCRIADIPGRKSTHAVFGGRALHLRSLWLANLRWIPANTFPSLTHLLIEFAGRLKNLRFSFRELFALLEGSPHLQVIYLTGLSAYGIKDTPPMDTIVRKITLAHLRKLRIEEERPGEEANKFQIAVCSHIIRPADCLIYVSIHNAPHFDHLASRLAISQPTRSMCIGFDYNGFSAYPGMLQFQLFNPLPSPGIRVDLCLDVRMDSPKYELTGDPKQLEPIRRAMSDSNGLFAHITTLHVHFIAFHYLSKDPFTLYSLTRLETISVEFTKPWKYPQSQYSLGESLHHSHDRPIAFPKLATLAAACEERPVDLVNIRGIAASRKRAGYPLTRLVLVYWSSPEDLPTSEELHSLVELYCDVESFDVFDAGSKEDISEKIHPVLSPVSKDCTYHGDVSRLWPKWR
ncbi:hypothetical protein C8Q80DRAFT_1145859 [Daedaleopsis nitida]|nr:hypothetical protein C8Q80DRAFT_1145859 [Daedaleopsis nitida]